MELVYLWVKEYKNIKNQGFNFSPRFTCKYDEASKKLTIDKKEHVSIFPKNINITAVVGENGSGKSSLIDLILDLDGWASTDKQLLFVVKNNKGLKCYLLNFLDYITCDIKQEKVIRGPETMLGSNGLTLSFLSLSPFLPKLDSYHANDINLYSKPSHENREFHYNSFMQSILADIPQLVEHEFINTFFNFKGKPKYFVFKYNKYIETIFQSETAEILEKSSIRTETDKTCTRQIDIHSDIFASLIELNKKVEELNRLNNSEKESINEEIKKIGSIKFFLSFDDSSKDKFHFSTGELAMLYYIKALLEVSKKEYDSILIIDECELFLHPAWQKKFINLLNKVFDNHDYKRQIIISSHSPFILSDLPKENVIFLENGKQVDVNISPFGANIHTLLSHGFFMKGGLMGEFAKGKINEVISTLKKDTLSKDEINTCKNIISIIGEPILKSTLEKMLDEKLNSNENELERLEREQKEIQEKIDRLKAKNETD